MIITSIAGLSLVTAIWLFTEATVHGKGGPALALTQLQSIVMIMLEIIFIGTVPTLPEAIGFGLGLCGACVIALSKKK